MQRPESRWLKGHSIYLWTGDGPFFKYRSPKKRKPRKSYAKRLMRLRPGD